MKHLTLQCTMPVPLIHSPVYCHCHAFSLSTKHAAVTLWVTCITVCHSSDRCSCSPASAACCLSSSSSCYRELTLPGCFHFQLFHPCIWNNHVHQRSHRQGPWKDPNAQLWVTACSSTHAALARSDSSLGCLRSFMHSGDTDRTTCGAAGGV